MACEQGLLKDELEFASHLHINVGETPSRG